MLEGLAREEHGLGVPGVVAGDAEGDEVERVRLGGVEGVEEVLGSRELRYTGIVRRERKLSGECIKGVDPELRHVKTIIAVIARRCQESIGTRGPGSGEKKFWARVSGVSTLVCAG